jgi:hypothetical protein
VGRSKKARWQYWIEGREAKRAEVEKLVFDTPELREKARRHEKIVYTSPILFVAGGPTAVAGGWVAALAHRPLLLLVTASGLATTITGFVLGFTAEDPLRGAVNAYNARREGLCRGREPPAPPPPEESWTKPTAPEPMPTPTAPEPMPTLPSRGWIP